MRSKLVLCAALIAAAACGRAPIRTAEEPPSPSPSATAIPTPSDSPARTSRGTLLFATKAGHTVTVQAVDLKTRAARILFAYEERAEAEHSGNMWDEQTPSIALSRDGRSLAYGAVDGLHVYDLEANDVETLVRRIAEERADSDARPKWSPDIDTYAFVNVRWSGDGRYLSFDEPQFEGNMIGFYDLARHRHFNDKAMPISYVNPGLGGIARSAAGASSAVTADGSKAGLFFSSVGDPEHSSFVRIPHVNISDAALSPDASLAAFLFSSNNDYPNDVEMDGIAFVRRDGSGLKTIDQGGTKSSVKFDADGDVLWMEGGTLYRWDGSSKTVAARLDDGYKWEILSGDGQTVALGGRSDESRRGLFVVLQRSTGKATAMHGVETDYVTFIGLP